MQHKVWIYSHFPLTRSDSVVEDTQEDTYTEGITLCSLEVKAEAVFKKDTTSQSQVWADRL